MIISLYRSFKSLFKALLIKVRLDQILPHIELQTMIQKYAFDGISNTIIDDAFNLFSTASMMQILHSKINKSDRKAIIESLDFDSINRAEKNIQDIILLMKGNQILEESSEVISPQRIKKMKAAHRKHFSLDNLNKKTNIQLGFVGEFSSLEIQPTGFSTERTSSMLPPVLRGRK